eukprot:15245921-Ditylum_brightwellii.AAC.1
MRPVAAGSVPDHTLFVYAAWTSPPGYPCTGCALVAGASTARAPLGADAAMPLVMLHVLTIVRNTLR